MEQNRKKIRIQKVVLSLLSVIFLAMAGGHQRHVFKRRLRKRDQLGL